MENLDAKNVNIIQTLFKNYWAMGNYNLQTSYLIKQSKSSPSAAQIKLGNANPNRNKNRTSYFVTYDSDNYVVCRKAFAAIHGVKLGKIDWLAEKRNITNTAELDQRGQNGHHNKMPEETLKLVHEFMATLPVRASHYTRKINEYRQYLDYRDKMSVPAIYKMYENYVRLHYPDADLVKEDYFRNIWNTQYNINTESPKVDICPVCHHLECRIDQAKAANKRCGDIQQEFDEHTAKADLAYLNLKMAKNTEYWKPEEWTTICIDLQQTHNIPKSPFGPHYYMRKLNVYNFCVHELQTKEPHFYVWPEFNGSKGAAEIYSCVYKYLEDHVFCKQNYPRKLRIMADNCGGQNKNNKLVLALLRLVHLKKLDRIELAFMVPGHSYLPCDQSFGVIANNIKTIQTIPSPDQLMKHIIEARSPAYKVYKLERNEIFNLDIFTEKDLKKRVALIRTPKDNPKAFSTASIIVMQYNKKMAIH